MLRKSVEQNGRDRAHRHDPNRHRRDHPANRSLYDGGTIAGLSDGQLLDRFNARRGSRRAKRRSPRTGRPASGRWSCTSAGREFWQTAMLPRMPFRPSSSCWPGRQAHSQSNLVGPWLYGVAIRTARKARSRVAHQRRHEEDKRIDERPHCLDSWSSGRREHRPRLRTQAIAREQAEAVHHEIDRLPKSFKLPVVLCYFEGLTLDEAAPRLDWPAGTVRTGWRGHTTSSRCTPRRGFGCPPAAIHRRRSAQARQRLRGLFRALRCDHDERGPVRGRSQATSRPWPRHSHKM